MTNEHWVEMYLKNIYYMYFLFSFLNPLRWRRWQGGGGGHALIHQRWNPSFINRQNLLSSNKRCKIQFLPTLKINWYLDLMIKSSHYGMNAIGLKYYHIYIIYIYMWGEQNLGPCSGLKYHILPTIRLRRGNYKETS